MHFSLNYSSFELVFVAGETGGGGANGGIPG